jgi:hypothetical protein
MRRLIRAVMVVSVAVTWEEAVAPHLGLLWGS